MTPLEHLASLFTYPDEGYARRLAASADAAGLESLRVFADAVAHVPTATLQEQYVEAFDLDPDCSPDLGWHLYGERYERGEWMASLRGDLRRLGLDASAELPDHLANVLSILARDDEARRELLATTIAPAIDRLRHALERRESPFRHAVTAVQEAVTSRTTGGSNA